MVAIIHNQLIVIARVSMTPVLAAVIPRHVTKPYIFAHRCECQLVAKGIISALQFYLLTPLLRLFHQRRNERNRYWMFDYFCSWT